VTVDRVAEENAVLGVEESDSIEKCAFGSLFQNQVPGLAAVGGAVDAGLAFLGGAESPILLILGP